MVAWNLVDGMLGSNASTTARRAFYLPLATIPPGQDHTRLVDRALYSFWESYHTLSAPDGRTSEVCLHVRIQRPAGGFIDEAGHPDPLVRLHAVDGGRLRFVPAGEGTPDSLILEMQTFAALPNSGIETLPLWFQRWQEAESIPLTLIYTNVDRAHLQVWLGDLRIVCEAVAGLHFPAEVTEASKAGFITAFLAGAPGHFMEADAGAMIGIAGHDPAHPQQRLLTLQARYRDDTPSDPHPMNPRELFYLLFGDDSIEAQSHPLLLRLHEFGQQEQEDVQPASKRMLLRPPLRTWKRVQWEAEQEIAHHAPSWQPHGRLGIQRFYNDYTRANGGDIADGARRFNRATYKGFNKCNLFVADICLRAGFCVCVHPVGHDLWHFIDANSFANHIQRVVGSYGRLAVRGAGEDRRRVWAWKIENEVRRQPASARQHFLNHAMHEEGRCFVLAGARPRQFVPHTIIGAPTSIQGIADCAEALRGGGTGHVVIVQSVQAEPHLKENVGSGLEQIEVQTWEATNIGAVSGAVSRTLIAKLGRKMGAGNGGIDGGFIRLHLFELQPGGDPDTVQGLRSLNVQNVNLNLLGTVEEAAADILMTHRMDGSLLAPPPAPQCFCHDNYPPGAPPTQSMQ